MFYSASALCRLPPSDCSVLLYSWICYLCTEAAKLTWRGGAGLCLLDCTHSRDCPPCTLTLLGISVLNSVASFALPLASLVLTSSDSCFMIPIPWNWASLGLALVLAFFSYAACKPARQPLPASVVNEVSASLCILLASWVRLRQDTR